MRLKYRATALSVSVVLLLAACTDNPTFNQAGPTLPPSTGDAETTARQFLDGWTAGDYDGMYRLLSPVSLVISKEAFTAAYKQAEQAMNLPDRDNKSYELLTDQTTRQGATTTLHYNMTFNSNALGKFTDKDRTMRLITTPSGWRVAWSTMDIFEGLAGGATLQLNRTAARRGSIYDRTDRLIAQDDVPNYAVRLLTREYPGGSPEACLDKLAEVFRLYRPGLDTYKQYTGQDRGFTIGTLSEPDWNALRGPLGNVCLLQGVRQVTRFMYGGGIAAQTVGFVGPVQREQLGEFGQYGEGAMVGQFGIERAWQAQLGGTPGAELVIRTADGMNVRTIFRRDSSGGQDVRVTIDRDLQLKVETAIASAYNYANWGQLKLPAPLTQGAALVVMDVKTGAVLAMASFPYPNPDAWLLGSTTFDVDTIQNYVKKLATKNFASQETYPLGSVMKIASMIAAEDTKEFKPDDTVNCTGLFPNPRGNPKFLTDWIYLEPDRKPNYHGEITLEQGLESSCDVYFWTIGTKLDARDANLWRIYGNKLGLGRKTGIDSITEADGLIPDPTTKGKLTGERWGVGDSLNTVIGQGNVQVSPIQVARMLSAVANGKIAPTPYLVRSVGYAGQQPTYGAQSGKGDTLDIEPAVLVSVRKALCDATIDPVFGTSTWVFQGWPHDQIQVCGKTGTAQSGSDYPHGWFAAFAGPKGEAPEIAVVGLVTYSREGSETAAPIVRRVLEAYYHIPYTPWPDFWTQPYEKLPKPGLGEGGPLK